jgi:kynurenine formamidase
LNLKGNVMTRLIDLSTPVQTGHFRWDVERKLLKSHDTGAGQATWAGWNLHAFTHMDSPRHVALAAAGAHLRAGDIALIRARWDERADINTPEFWLHAPWITAEAAIWLRERGIKAIGFDFPQDYCIRFFLTGEKRPPLPEHVTHYHLLKQGIIMFEYLRNMGALRQARNQIVALPIRIPDSDGAPARVIAMEEAG